MAQLESKVVEKDRKIRKLKGMVNELADEIAHRERHTRIYQDKSEDQTRQHKKE